MGVYIVDGKRTAIGSFQGSLASMSAHRLSVPVIQSILKSNQIEPGQIDEVILGQVLTTGEGQNPARQAAIHAGIPNETPAMTINQVCGSGLRAVAMGYQAIALNERSMVMVGGQESMSRSNHFLYLRSGVKIGTTHFQDSMIVDGLWDAFYDCHMAITAENIAKKFGITRQEQDEFATYSQTKAQAAQNNQKFSDEIVSIQVPKGKELTIFCKDEYPRAGVTIESLSKLKPAFLSEGGTVTAGNASGINDGSAVLLMASENKVKQLNLTPMARIVSWATCGVDPQFMGLGPIPASRQAIEKAGWNIDDLDLMEVNEAFAAQAIAVNQEMGWDVSKVNVNGGAIALGHPIGASGARILVTLIHEMKRKRVKKGLATLCIGGGMGIAVCVESSY